jgi:hypothetical protein
MFFYDFISLSNRLVQVNWLDPSDKGTPEEQEEVLNTLWNFCIEQEEEEERIYDENNSAFL